MSIEDKNTLILDIYQVYYEYDLDNFVGEFLAYLYPAIVADEKCQLWGSDDNDIIILLSLQNNFDIKHNIWKYIEVMEDDMFVVDAIYYTKWRRGDWEFQLENSCYYNCFKQAYYGLNEDVYSGQGDLIEEFLTFEIKENVLFDNEYVFKVNSPQKMCDFCGENDNNHKNNCETNNN